MSSGKLPITAAQHRKILAVTTDPEFRLFLEILWETGARPLDAARLSAEQIDRVGKRLKIYPRKFQAVSGYYTGLPLSKRVLEILASRPASGPFFPRFEKAGPIALGRYFSILCRKARVLGFVSIHSYRLRLLLKDRRLQ